ncbi:MAG TPA: 50S ribosomal protein L29 [Thermoanaerobaculia bacterium]|nr:50S ribosomal protein L29 [Thermoanaerobaculia bacterium]
MKPAELRDSSVDELLQKEKDLAEQLFALRLQKVTGQLEKPARVRQVRRDLARVLTVLATKRSAAGSPASGR